MDLDDWRSRINDLDEQILNLLNQRGHAALQIGGLKRQQERPYFVPEREAQVLERLASMNRGPLSAEAVRAIWREILSASLALENPLPVAFLGPAGTFTHAAAMRRFGTSANLIPVKTNASSARPALIWPAATWSTLWGIEDWPNAALLGMSTTG